MSDRPVRGRAAFDALHARVEFERTRIRRKRTLSVLTSGRSKNLPYAPEVGRRSSQPGGLRGWLADEDQVPLIELTGQGSEDQRAPLVRGLRCELSLGASALSF